MLLGTTWNNQWDYWGAFNHDNVVLDHVVMFDGGTKTIWILEGIDYVAAREQLYSDWKEWVSYQDHSKYEQAFETEGGRPVSDTERLGESFFLINDWTIRQRNASTTTVVEGNVYAYDENGEPKDPYGFDPYGNKSISSQTSLQVSTVVEYRDVVVEVPVPVEIEVPVLSDEQDLTMRLTYEEARRARAMQTNKVDIGRVGAGASATDTVQVYDDDGVTLLYTIVVTGEDADNRQVTYIKNYPDGYPDDPNAP